MSTRTSSVRAAIRLRKGMADAVSTAAPARSELSAFSRLLLLLHEGILDSRRWQQFLEAIAQHLDGNAAVLVLQLPTAEGPGLVYTWGTRREYEAAFTSHCFVVDPFVQLPEGKVVTLHELMPREQLETSELYRDFPVASEQKLFGLTQKEAMLALLLADGRTLRQAAHELDVSLNTARAHLRAIFAKTGIDRQTKLVRAVLTSVATLG